MTATANREPARAPEVRSTGGTLAGTGTLIRFILRRDRIRLPAWLLGITALLGYVSAVLSEVYQTRAQLQDAGRFIGGSFGAVFSGPGYGLDDLTLERAIVGAYSLWFFVLTALMNMLLVSRHTRLDEQHGRAELIRANVVGRHAPLTAVLIVAAGANGLLALMVGGAMAANDYGAGDGLLFGAGIGAVGLVFAGITALTVQVTEYSRTAVGLAGAALGAAWAIRAAGDLIREHGSPLSWCSPLAWSQQTRPYVDARWWPLLLSLGLATAAAAAGYAVSTRRDVGAGLVAPRAGRPAAAPWLRSPLAVAFRQQRASLIWWTAALAAAGFLWGAVAESMADPADMDPDRIEMFGGSLDSLVDGYLGVVALFTSALAGIMVILSVQTVRGEETKGRVEPVLATATSRWAWLGSHLLVVAVGLVGLLLVVGFTTGVGAALAAGDAGYVGEMVAAYLVHAPGLLILLGIAALLFGLLPRAIGAAWLVLGYGMLAGVFGSLLDLPQWAHNVSPMEHAGKPPLDSIAWPAIPVLTAIAVGLAAAGLAAFRRRDLETK